VALLSVLVGAAQLSGGDGNGFRFYNPDEIFLNGFQTNHNAQADVLLIGLVTLAAVAADWAAPQWAGRRQRPVGSAPPVDPRLVLSLVGGASLLLALGVVLTASRTGIALLPMAIGAQGLILRRLLVRGLGLDLRRVVIGAMLVVAAVAMAAVAIGNLGGQHGTLARVWARFHTPVELRPEIWRDSWFAMRQYWPWGAGMGSFIPVFAAAERLEVVTQRFVNRAHDDYLEFLIEAGLPGILVFGLICRQIVHDAWRSWRTRTAGSPAQMICGAAAISFIMVHSLGDYPLRSMSIACMIGACAGLLLPVAQGPHLGNVNQP
jgi:O-antigen ligase